MKTSKNSRKSQLYYFIKTFGCQMNISDSERIAGFLELHKFKPAKDINSADLVIFNTCGVRQMAEDRAYGQIHNLRKKYPEIKIILTGCLANRKDVQKRLKNKVDLFCEIKNFPEKITELIHKKLLVEYPSDSYDIKLNQYLNIKPKYSTPFSAYVPIMTGCNNFCSYCIVPYARGREVSRPTNEIIKEVKSLVRKKYKEIILLGQNVNSYSHKKTGFAELLDNLARNNPGINFKFLTSHPKDFSGDLMKVIAKNKNIDREIHLPVQAGSDKILKAMNRPYTQKHYLDLINKIKKNIPGASFTTDIIVGFPGETKEDFAESVKIFKQVGYNEAYINKYSPRPGTAAWKLKETVDLPEKKRRERILRSLVGYGKKK
ncbi:MAG: tRNA (N6-isopentenyl adenosine(37)-C2)-methylthiotransferase MiaB [Parcubacteria group bacterium]